jgi:hypothetical protein
MMRQRSNTVLASDLISLPDGNSGLQLFDDEQLDSRAIVASCILV